MGYRSTVLIAINKEAIAKAIVDKGLPGILNEADEHYTDPETAQYWVFMDRKWYDTYEDISRLLSFLGKLSDDDYGYIRSGEENGDVESLGNPWNYDMSTVTYISSPIGDFS